MGDIFLRIKYFEDLKDVYILIIGTYKKLCKGCSEAPQLTLATYTASLLAMFLGK